MKVRIKFTKEGPMKFVGHLDTMRYFQKAIRRAELPIAFSGGYSPHMIMSFAAPLELALPVQGNISIWSLPLRFLLMKSVNVLTARW